MTSQRWAARHAMLAFLPLLTAGLGACSGQRPQAAEESIVYRAIPSTACSCESVRLDSQDILAIYAMAYFESGPSLHREECGWVARTIVGRMCHHDDYFHAFNRGAERSRSGAVEVVRGGWQFEPQRAIGLCSGNSCASELIQPRGSVKDIRLHSSFKRYGKGPYIIDKNKLSQCIASVDEALRDIGAKKGYVYFAASQKDVNNVNGNGSIGGWVYDLDLRGGNVYGNPVDLPRQCNLLGGASVVSGDANAEAGGEEDSDGTDATDNVVPAGGGETATAVGVSSEIAFTAEEKSLCEQVLTYGGKRNINTCAKSLKNGAKDSLELFNCSLGMRQTCDSSCVANPLGQHDTCAVTPLSAAEVALCRDQLVHQGRNNINTCEKSVKSLALPSSLYLFDCGSGVKRHCQQGCQAKALGTDDTCAE